MKENIAVVRTVAVRDTKHCTRVPVQISVIRYESGKQTGIYDSMIRPMREIESCLDMPSYLNADILSQAPSPYDIALEIKKFAQNCEIDADEASSWLLANC